MPIVVNYDAIENRIKQGIAAGAGTMAMVSVAAFRIGHEKGLPLHPAVVFKFSAIVSVISGVIWALMPNAQEEPTETLEKAKQQFYPAIKVGINRILQNEQLLRDTLSTTASDDLTYRKPSYSYSHRPSSNSSRTERRLAMFDRKISSSFDTGFEDDDVPSEEDFYTDEEYDEILREELTEDPFYEGPSSVFDRY